MHEQSRKSDPFVTTEISESEASPRAAFLSSTGVDSKHKSENPIDEVVPAQPGKILETAKGLQLLQEIERKNVDNAGDDVEEHDSSDSDNDQHFRQNARQRRLRKQRRTRLRILLDEMSEQGHLQESNSYLQLRSVSGMTRNKYRAATQNFLQWSDKMKVPLATESELNAGLAHWMNMMYAEGHRAWQGEWVVAGLLFFLPEYGKASNKSIPSSLRFLKGWRKLSPSFSRKPLTWPVSCALAVEMTRLGHPLLSIMVLLSVECYLRPSEALSLTGQSLLPPATSAVPHWVVLLFPQENRQRSKVGAADDTVAIDSGRVNWMQRVFPVLANRQKSQPLFQTDYQSFLEVFRRATNNIGIEAVPYQMRHSGPSLDLAQGIRDITSCQKLGFWATMTSLKRYEKHGRLNDTWRLLSPGTQAYCLTCEHDAEGYILAGKTCPLPPRLVE